MFIGIAVFILAVVVFGVIYKTSKDNELLETVTSNGRGERSERRLILQLLKENIPANQIFHDVYIPRQSGYAQIDTVVVSSVGIIVFEVKRYSGWIFGNGYNNYWTKILNYGKEKYRFYNPIKQNEGHIRALKGFLKEDVPYYSVIVFAGDCVLKDLSYIPQNVYVCYSSSVINIVKNIKSQNNPCTYINVQMVLEKMQHAMQLGEDPAVREQQIRQAQYMATNKPADSISLLAYIPRIKHPLRYITRSAFRRLR